MVTQWFVNGARCPLGISFLLSYIPVLQNTKWKGKPLTLTKGVRGRKGRGAARMPQRYFIYLEKNNKIQQRAAKQYRIQYRLERKDQAKTGNTCRGAYKQIGCGNKTGGVEDIMAIISNRHIRLQLEGVKERIEYRADISPAANIHIVKIHNREQEPNMYVNRLLVLSNSDYRLPPDGILRSTHFHCL